MTFGGRPFGGAAFGANPLAPSLATPPIPPPTPLPAPPDVVGGASFINGWSLRIADASARQRSTRVGPRGRSYRRQMRDARRYTRKSWECDAVVADADEARTLEHVLLGEGHFFDFASGLDAQTGLGPLAGYQGLRLLPSTWGAFGRGALGFEAAAGGTLIRWDAQLETEWTIVVRIWDAARSLWVGHGIRDDGLGFINGVENGSFNAPGSATGLYFKVIDGVVEVVKDGAFAIVVDDLAILPYRACDSAMVSWTRPTTTTTKMGPCPAVRVRGDIFGAPTGAGFLAMGNVTGVDIIGKPTKVGRFGWVNNSRIVRFALDALKADYVRTEVADDAVTPLPPVTPVLWAEALNTDGAHNVTRPVDGTLVSPVANLGSRTTTLSVLGAPKLVRMTKSAAKLGNGAYFNMPNLTDVLDEAGIAAVLTPPYTIAVVWATNTIAATARDIVDGNSLFKLRRSGSSAIMSAPVGNDVNTNGIVVDGWNLHIGHFAAVGAHHILNALDDALAADYSVPAGAHMFTIGGGFASKSGHTGKVAAVLVFEGAIDLVALQAFMIARYGVGLSFPQ